MTREDVPQDVHDVLWTAYRDAGGNLDAGAVELAREVVRLRAKLQAAREKIHALDCWDIVGNCEGDSGMCTTDIERVSDGQYLDRDDVLAALGGDE